MGPNLNPMPPNNPTQSPEEEKKVVCHTERGGGCVAQVQLKKKQQGRTENFGGTPKMKDTVHLKTLFLSHPSKKNVFIVLKLFLTEQLTDVIN